MCGSTLCEVAGDGGDLGLFDGGLFTDLQPCLGLLDTGEGLVGLGLEAVGLAVLALSLLLKTCGFLGGRLVLLMRRHLLE